uniref:NADH-ubiquinone oxidoreductase chain 5 n=1 Tax=Polyplax spinulosa TaxID=468197 RepID=V9PXD0_9NEOP|nr:NADH dehydrogenase subunit 5 [Polyplax spinulosa]
MMSQFVAKVWWELTILMVVLTMWKYSVTPGVHSLMLEVGEWLGGLTGEEVSFCFDQTSAVFLFMVLVVSTSVTKYSSYYINSKDLLKFLSLLSFFILSMILLCLSTNFIWSLVGWDGLGLTSLFLILYYSNWNSSTGGLVTFLVNRLGDLFLLSSIFLLSVSSGMLWMGGSNKESLFGILFILGVLAKSAQFPYSSWLPLAMAAPTPVSSLVHSSTLVTAGVFMIVRSYFHFSEATLFLMKIMSFLTIFYSGLSAIVEQDLKKIIAYSTLSHLSIMVFLISMGSLEAALCHMFIHALFKSMLFMVAGVILHEESGRQDSRSLILLISRSPILSSMFSASIISMMGIPFLSGFTSKEMMMSMSFSNFDSFWNVLGMISSIFFSSAYSTRMVLFMSQSAHPSVSLSGLSKPSTKMCSSLWVSFKLNLLSGTFILPILFPDLCPPAPEVESGVKVLVVLSLLTGGLLGLSSFTLYKELFKMNDSSIVKEALLMVTVSFSWVNSFKKVFTWFPILDSFGVAEKWFGLLKLSIKAPSSNFFKEWEAEITPMIKSMSLLSIVLFML